MKRLKRLLCKFGHLGHPQELGNSVLTCSLCGEPYYKNSIAETATPNDPMWREMDNDHGDT